MYQRLVAALGWWFLLAVVQAQAAGEATAPGDGSWALDEMPTTAGEWGGCRWTGRIPR